MRCCHRDRRWMRETGCWMAGRNLASRIEHPVSSIPTSAFTLVEVVAGLTLFAALIVGVLLSFGVHHRQMRFAHQRMTAMDIADAMLTRWQTQPDGVPLLAGGPLPFQPNWIWRTQPVSRRFVAGVPVDIIRLEIIAPAGTSADARQLCSIEVVRRVNVTGGGGLR